MGLCLLPSVAAAQDVLLPDGAIGCPEVVIAAVSMTAFRQCPETSCKAVKWDDTLDWTFDSSLIARYGDWLLVDSSNLLWLRAKDARVELGGGAPLNFDPDHPCLVGVKFRYLEYGNYNNHPLLNPPEPTYEWARGASGWKRRVSSGQSYPVPKTGEHAR